MKKHEYGTPEHWETVLDSEFSKESDRAAVVLVGALLDSALESLLRAVLIPSPTSTDEIFDTPNAPLSTFSSRINLAHRLGLISSQFCRDLHIIRKIRNEFSHDISACTFGHGSVRARVLELAKSSGLIERNPTIRKTYPEGPRGDFQMIASWMLFYLNQLIERIEPIESKLSEWGYNKTLRENMHEKKDR